MFSATIADSKTILVVRLESNTAMAKLVSMEQGRAAIMETQLPTKDMRDSVGSIEEHRIGDIVAGYTNQVKSQLKVQPAIVAVTCPGTIDSDCQTISRSSRLSVLKPFECGKLLKQSHGIEVCVFNDAICMSRAELSAHSEHATPKNAAFIRVGQGVGCAIYLQGELYCGAGAGGHIGRIVVNPEGPMSSRFNQSGTLEAYTTHDSIVQRLISLNRDDIEKTPEDEFRAKPYYHFRQVLKSVKHPLDVEIQQIAQAWEQGDPLVIEAVNDAGKYLGRAISYIITLLNPELIVVGGELIEGLPTYFEHASACAKRLSSRLAWERTKLVRSTMGLTAQFIGAAELAWLFLDRTSGQRAG
jgi:transcriptional regulator of PTS gene